MDDGSGNEGGFGPPDAPVAYFDGFTGKKALTDYVDPISTGRKEAARKFPIAKGQICEWAYLAQAGGGVEPIIGCVGYPATDIHHGPDKNTLRNVVGNVHRICVYCHNRWHAKNDPHYGKRATYEDGKIDPTVPFIPEGEYAEHDPETLATDDEVFEEEKRRRNESRKHGNLA